jgi:hypothetical protein
LKCWGSTNPKAAAGTELPANAFTYSQERKKRYLRDEVTPISEQHDRACQDRWSRLKKKNKTKKPKKSLGDVIRANKGVSRTFLTADISMAKS